MFLIFGDKYLYTGRFNHLGSGLRKFEVIECEEKSENIDIVEFARSKANKNRIISPLRKGDNERIFGQRMIYGRYIPSVNYSTIKPEIVELEIEKIIDFKNFSIDTGLNKYGGFFSDLAGLRKSNSESKIVFVPGVRSHVLYKLRSKFKRPFSILQASEFKVFNGVNFEEIESICKGQNLVICADKNSYYWRVMQDWQSCKVESLLAPYDVKEIVVSLIPKLERMLFEGKLSIDAVTGEKLISEISSFSFKSDMAYESLDNFPLMRACLYIAKENFYFASCESRSYFSGVVLEERDYLRGF